MHTTSDEKVLGWVLYDGQCGICAQSAPRWSKTLASIGLGVAPLQAPWVQERLTVPPEELLHDIRLLFADGHQLAGPEVYRYAMRRLWWAFPIYLLSVTPGLRWIFNRAYRIFADRRLKISHVCHIAPPPSTNELR